ncbi:unnamed protein product [Prorocentrum cordatum]|uniref:Uncharacterized protein n=1 Tax=Prorocentrum cordatum TaxID=2364126 RepID=A0ABN9T0H6_9DINO|nr:unnamed protein product [Polarella glacialis]
MLGPSRQPRKPGLELLELLKPAEAASGDASGPASRPADAAAEGASRPSPAQAGDAEVGCCPSWLAGGSSPLREPFLGSSCPGGEEAEEDRTTRSGLAPP